MLQNENNPVFLKLELEPELVGAGAGAGVDFKPNSAWKAEATVLKIHFWKA